MSDDVQLLIAVVLPLHRDRSALAVGRDGVVRAEHVCQRDRSGLESLGAGPLLSLVEDRQLPDTQRDHGGDENSRDQSESEGAAGEPTVHRGACA